MGGFAVIARSEAAAVFELIEGALDPVTLLVERGVIGAGRPAAGPRRNDWRGTLAFDVLNEFLTIIASVGNDVAGAEAGEEGKGLRTVVPLPSGNNKAHGPAPAIHGQMNLGCQSASGTPQSRVRVPPFPVAACWCARTIVLSSMR